MGRWAKTAAGLAVVSVLAAAVAWYATGERARGAPDVSLTLVNEQPVRLSELYDGSPLLVVFWATDCVQCVHEVPSLVQLYQRYHGRGLDLVAVAMAHDPPARVWAFVREHALPYRVSLDMDRRVASAFGGVDATPTLMLIDGTGRIVLRHTGQLPKSRLESAIRDLLES